jgi:molecular chaperone GrpE
VSHSDDQNMIDEDAYVIEDSGESLESFDLEKEEAAARAEADVDEAPDGMAVSSAELTRLQNENAEMKDRLLRARADFENFRKRAERDKADHFKYALTDIVRELLPVIDNFERALSVKTDSAPDLLTGIELIYKQLGDVLLKKGLRVIEEVPAPFDPSYHEAVTSEQNPDVPNHTVTEILQKGYVLNERLIRPAMVKVAVGGPEVAREPAADAGEAPDSDGGDDGQES